MPRLPTWFAPRSTEFLPRAQPGPLSLAPSGLYSYAQKPDDLLTIDSLGDDGAWTAFQFQIGTPSQSVSLLASSALSQTFAIASNGCPVTIPNCQADRGGTFNSTFSSTWKELNNDNVTLEQNLGASVPGISSSDILGVTLSDDTIRTLPSQTFVEIDDTSYWLGIVGLQPTSDGDTQASLLSSLKTQGAIPSRAFGYTAGNQYRAAPVPGSLTLGGYDAARFQSTGLSLSLEDGSPRQMAVELQSISTDINGSKKDLLGSGVQVLVDTTVSDFWLPSESYTLFENVFGLTWNASSSIYTVSPERRDMLKSTNPNITLSMSASPGGATVDFVLPYAAFDLSASWPRYNNYPETIDYFPLRRAANTDQLILGRAFFQEVYLIVDFENSTFSLSQCIYPSGLPANIVPIIPTTSANSSQSSVPATGGSNGSTIGIAVGVTVGVLVILGIVAALWWRKHRGKRAGRAADEKKSSEGTSDLGTSAVTRPEVQSESNYVGQSPHMAGLHGEMNTGLDHERFEAPTQRPTRNAQREEYLTPPSGFSPRASSPLSELAGDASQRLELHSGTAQPRAELGPHAAPVELLGSPVPSAAEARSIRSPDLSPLRSAAGSPDPQHPTVSPLQTPQIAADDDSERRPPLDRNPSSMTSI